MEPQVSASPAGAVALRVHAAQPTSTRAAEHTGLDHRAQVVTQSSADERGGPESRVRAVRDAEHQRLRGLNRRAVSCELLAALWGAARRQPTATNNYDWEAGAFCTPSSGAAGLLVHQVIMLTVLTQGSAHLRKLR